jgi:hypothetical protein
MSSAVVVFKTGFEKFSVFVSDISHAKLAKYLSNKTSVRSPGAAATALVRNNENASLCGSGQTADYTYTVNVHLNWIYVEDRMRNTLYNGSFASFEKWAKVNSDLNEAIDKVVRFRYRGGSENGERLIKLTSVLGSGGNTLLKGWDIHKSTADKPAYRTYRLSNIIGNVEIVG